MKYRNENLTRTIIDTHDPDKDSSRSRISLIELLKEIKTVPEKQKAQWAGMSPKTYSRLMNHEIRVEIEHIKGLVSLMYKIIFHKRDIPEESYVTYTMLKQMLPKAMHRYLIDFRADEKKRMRDLWESRKMPVKHYMFECENGTELIIKAKLNDEGEIVFRGRSVADKKDFNIYGAYDMIQFIKKGGRVRSNNSELGVIPTPYGIGSSCKAANSQVVHLYKRLVDGKRIKLV